MSKEDVKNYILEQFYKYYDKTFGWRNHRNRSRFIYNQILKENSVGSLNLIIKNEISLMEKGIPLGDNNKNLDSYFNSKWSKSMKNRNHVTVQNSEYRRVLDRCNSYILKYLDLRGGSSKSSFSQHEISKSSFSQHEISKSSFSQHEINEKFLKNKIREVKNDFTAKISNTCPEYSVLLATKIFFKKDYYNVLNSLKQNQRVIDEQLDIIGARHMAGLLGLTYPGLTRLMSNPEDDGVFYTIETFGLPKLDGAYNEVLIQKNKKNINAKNIEKLKEILPKNNLYLVRSGGSRAGHFFCMYVSFDNFFKIDVMGGNDLCCQPLIKSGGFNDDFAEKFRFTGSISFYRINNIEDINFFVKVIIDEKYRDTLIF